MEIKDLIKTRRIQRGLTMKELADIVGVSEATISRYESGDIANMRRKNIITLSKALDIPPSRFICTDKELQELEHLSIENVFDVKKKRLPMLGNIACGEPTYAEEDWEGFVEVGADINADFCIRAKGDSMTGARIFDGDIIFIHKQDMVENGEIAAVLVEDEATLKRVSYDQDAGILTLYPDNPMYKPLRYEGPDLNNIRILGKAVSCQFDIN